MDNYQTENTDPRPSPRKYSEPKNYTFGSPVNPTVEPQPPSDGWEGDTPSLFIEINEAASCLLDCQETLRNAQQSAERALERLNHLQLVFDKRIGAWRGNAPGVTIWGSEIQSALNTNRVR